jgi:hypothetical protein
MAQKVECLPSNHKTPEFKFTSDLLSQILQSVKHESWYFSNYF